MKKLDTFFTFLLALGVSLGLPFVSYAATNITPDAGIVTSPLSVTMLDTSGNWWNCPANNDGNTFTRRIQFRYGNGATSPDLAMPAYTSTSYVFAFDMTLDPGTYSRSGQAYCKYTLGDNEWHASDTFSSSGDWVIEPPPPPPPPPNPLVSIPTSTVSGIASRLSGTIADPGLLLVIVFVLALPVIFWIIHRIKKQFPKTK